MATAVCIRVTGTATPPGFLTSGSDGAGREMSVEFHGIGGSPIQSNPAPAASTISALGG